MNKKNRHKIDVDNYILHLIYIIHYSLASHKSSQQKSDKLCFATLTRPVHPLALDQNTH